MYVIDNKHSCTSTVASSPTQCSDCFTDDIAVSLIQRKWDQVLHCGHCRVCYITDIKIYVVPCIAQCMLCLKYYRASHTGDTAVYVTLWPLNCLINLDVFIHYIHFRATLRFSLSYPTIQQKLLTSVNQLSEFGFEDLC